METKVLRPLRAIREKCKDCAGTSLEVELCPIPDCSLYPYRFGKRPGTERKKKGKGESEIPASLQKYHDSRAGKISKREKTGDSKGDIIRKQDV